MKELFLSIKKNFGVRGLLKQGNYKIIMVQNTIEE
jgi:hypothetical protein